MAKLKCLSMTLRRKSHFSLFKKLSSMTHILNSLQGLQIHASFYDNWQRTTLLPVLIESQNVLKNLTHLSLGTIADEKSCELLKALPKHCTSLESLRFSIPGPYLRSDMDDPNMKSPKTSAPPGDLQALENFERLERLHIVTENPWAVIDNFTGPPGLKHVILFFSKWRLGRDLERIAFN